MKFKYLLAASMAGLASTAVMAPIPAAAQQITSGIEGTVSDENGTPLVGATVVVTDTRTGTSRTVTTQEGGRFSVINLTVGGPYTIAASQDGYEGQTVEGITTSLQGNTGLTFQLTSGSGAIVVTGTRVRATRLAVGPGTGFGVEVLESAPTFNRDVRDIIRLDPRVSLDRDDNGSGQDRISCLGGNDRGNAFTVDGISQGDVFGLNDTGFSSRSSTPLPYDATRETQVQFAPFDVDYGNFTGCAINVVTKSGSNEYKFGGFFEYSDNGLRAKGPLDDRGKPVLVAPIQPERRYGVWAGGPIIKDRLFLFGAYEHQEAGQSQDDGPVGGGYANEQNGITVAQFNEISQVIRDVYKIDTGPLVTNRPFTNDRYFVRADLQITDNHRLEATYQRLEEASTLPDDLFTGSSPQAVGQNTFRISGTESNYYSGRLYSQWSDNFSTELRYSRAEVQDLQDPIGGGEAQSANPIPRIIVGIDNPTGIDGTVLAGPGNSRSGNDLQTKIDQFRAAAVWNIGNHKVKFGGEWNHADLFNLFVQNATGTLVFRNINDLRAGLLSPGVTVRNATNTANICTPTTTTTPINVVNGCTRGAFGNFSATGDVRDAAAAFTRDLYSVFVQDEWSITDRLQAVLGVRADWYDGGRPALNPLFQQRYDIANNYSFSNLDPLIMPRLALSYDAGDFAVFSRAKVRAGVGIFSGGDPLVWFANAFQNDGRGFATGSTADAACGLAPGQQLDVVVNGQFTGVPSCFQQAASASAAKGEGDTQSISPNITQPSVLRANVGFTSDLNFTDSGFFNGWALTLDYIYSKYRNPFTLVDLSQTVASVGTAALGVNGFTIDGRPIYRAIDPNVAGCTAQLVGLNPAPVFTGVNAACFNTQRDDELQLTNSDGFESHIASIILAKRFEGGLATSGGNVDFNIGYSYTDAQDRRNMYSSTAGSNYDQSAAFDRQNPAASRGFYSSTHNLTSRLAFTEKFAEDLATRLSFTFVARSGRPYSLTFAGGGIFADDQSGSDNALAYIPTGATDPNVAPTAASQAAAQAFADFAKTLDCASEAMGRTIERNTCENDWYYDLDVAFSQEIPGPGRLFGRDDKFKLYATMDNFLNFLDNSWNLQRRRNFVGLQDVARVTGVDAQGRYIFTAFDAAAAIRNDNFVNVSSSAWRLKLGISYEF